MSPGFILILCTLFAEIAKEKQKLIKIKPFDWWGWIIIGVLGIAAFVTYKENEKSDKEIIELTTESKLLNKQIDTLRKDNKDAQERIYYSQERHSTEIRATATNLASEYTSGTRSIIENAAQEAKIMRDTIKNLKERQLPHLTYTLANDPITTLQSNDTFYVFTRVRNSGGSVAKDVSFKAYYLYSDGLRSYEYWRPITIVTQTEIPAGETKFALKGNAAYMTNFLFDSTEKNQFLLILGEYTSECGDKPLPVPFKLGHRWNTDIQKWAEFPDVTILENTHNDPRTIRFKEKLR